MPFYLFVCMFIAHTLAAQNPALDVQGHRGCRGLMPENTIPAFLKALELGVTTLELDVVISADNQVVVSHEPYFNAAITLTPDGQPINKKEQKQLNLYRMPYADIKQYDVGSVGNPAYPEQQPVKTHKPLLSDVIRAAEAYQKKLGRPACAYNIEIKSVPSEYGVYQPEPEPFSDLVYAQIMEQLPPERVIIQSFDFAVLKHWKTRMTEGKYRNVRLAALVENTRSIEKNLAELGFLPDIYSPYFRLLSGRKISRLHQQGIRVIPWTVNRAEDMNRLIAWGVDGLITDYPNRYSELMHDKR
ncbi:glycerophosphodiester phosphodiesterase family protein [Rudanella lutea]|uniref:glycerophosphodiester phosphodiesterase family protein n=1 Tax=Rudanella lutea TaxID=451374 RepID=UPI00037171F8